MVGAYLFGSKQYFHQRFLHELGESRKFEVQVSMTSHVHQKLSKAYVSTWPQTLWPQTPSIKMLNFGKLVVERFCVYPATFFFAFRIIPPDLGVATQWWVGLRSTFQQNDGSISMTNHCFPPKFWTTFAQEAGSSSPWGRPILPPEMLGSKNKSLATGGR